MFTKGFDTYACFGDTITTKEGPFVVTARIVHDEFMGPPWEEHDGHGPVSPWTRRPKAPGERVLHEDRGSYRYYDWQEAIKIAKRDGWGFGEGTKGQQAVRAVQADFEAMRAWCRNKWHWCGIVLSIAKNGITLDDHATSLWGIELNYPGSDNSFLLTVANELLDEAIQVGTSHMEKLCSDWKELMA